MPASLPSLAAASEPSGPPNENAAVQRAYCLISQLRGHGPMQSAAPRTTLGPDWRESDRTALLSGTAGYTSPLEN